LSARFEQEKHSDFDSFVDVPAMHPEQNPEEDRESRVVHQSPSHDARITRRQQREVPEAVEDEQRVGEGKLEVDQGRAKVALPNASAEAAKAGALRA